MGAGNPENLIPLNKRSARDVKRITSMGGKASVEKRRRDKTIAEGLKILMSTELVDEEVKEFVVKNFKTDDDKITNGMAVNMALMMKAMRSDVQAFIALRDTIGEKPVDKQELSGPDGSELPHVRIIDERKKRTSNTK